MRRTSGILLLLAALPAATPAEAQFGRAGQTDPVSRLDVRGGVMAALLIGSASDFLDGGTGVAGTRPTGRRRRPAVASAAAHPGATRVDADLKDLP